MEKSYDWRPDRFRGILSSRFLSIWVQSRPLKPQSVIIAVSTDRQQNLCVRRAQNGRPTTRNWQLKMFLILTSLRTSRCRQVGTMKNSSGPRQQTAHGYSPTTPAQPCLRHSSSPSSIVSNIRSRSLSGIALTLFITCWS